MNYKTLMIITLLSLVLESNAKSIAKRSPLLSDIIDSAGGMTGVKVYEGKDSKVVVGGKLDKGGKPVAGVGVEFRW